LLVFFCVPANFSMMQRGKRPSPQMFRQEWASFQSFCGTKNGESPFVPLIAVLSLSLLKLRGPPPYPSAIRSLFRVVLSRGYRCTFPQLRRSAVQHLHPRMMNSGWTFFFCFSDTGTPLFLIPNYQAGRLTPLGSPSRGFPFLSID